MASRYTEEELKKRMGSSGWRLVTGMDGKPVLGTLEDIAKATHERHKGGQAPGLIEEVETAIELDMIQIEKLWRYLGLPV
jgi:hypothetical protein